MDDKSNDCYSIKNKSLKDGLAEMLHFLKSKEDKSFLKSILDCIKGIDKECIEFANAFDEGAVQLIFGKKEKRQEKKGENGKEKI